MIFGRDVQVFVGLTRADVKFFPRKDSMLCQPNRAKIVLDEPFSSVLKSTSLLERGLILNLSVVRLLVVHKSIQPAT